MAAIEVQGESWKEPASSFDYLPVIQERTSTVGDFLLCASALTAVHVDVWVRLHRPFSRLLSFFKCLFPPSYHSHYLSLVSVYFPSFSIYQPSLFSISIRLSISHLSVSVTPIPLSPSLSFGDSQPLLPALSLSLHIEKKRLQRIRPDSMKIAIGNITEQMMIVMKEERQLCGHG